CPSTIESKYINPTLSEVALLLKNALLSLENVDIFLLIITSPHIMPTITDVATFLMEWFPRVASVDKDPNMAVALSPLIARVDARISNFLDHEFPGSLFLALVIILHGVAHSMCHHFIPIAIWGSCLVDDEDQWLSDPGYKVEHALFSGIIGISFAGSPTDPELPEISHFTLYTKDGDLYMIGFNYETNFEDLVLFSVFQQDKNQLRKFSLCSDIQLWKQCNDNQEKWVVSMFQPAGASQSGQIQDSKDGQKCIQQVIGFKPSTPNPPVLNHEEMTEKKKKAVALIRSKEAGNPVLPGYKRGDASLQEGFESLYVDPYPASSPSSHDSIAIPRLSMQLFIPSVQIFSFSDIIPFHILLSGPLSSLHQFFPQVPSSSSSQQ
ncbi:hypothetical protein IW261DRAFT_1686080, partial [Armillaria novae-zelandiae]